MDKTILKREEAAVFALRELYCRYGYTPYRMSKFEAYEFYLQNKEFLVSDRIITFHDTDGELMALKPDVTLSIVKNGTDAPGCIQRSYYNENVYRVSGSSHQFREIMQTGLECIGDLDFYEIYEVILLAARSLACIAEEYVLDVSHLGLLGAILDETGADESFRQQAARCIAEKNAHDLQPLCRAAGVSAEVTDKLKAFVGIYGEMECVLQRLSPLCTTREEQAALRQLQALASLLQATPYAGNIHFDFSIVNNMKYYNGFVFKGFLRGVCQGVLAGGQYDKLMVRLGRSARAIGFALYLDLLDELEEQTDGLDVDVLLLYDAATPPQMLAAKIEALQQAGRRVSAQRAVPEKLRYETVIDLRKEAAEC